MSIQIKIAQSSKELSDVYRLRHKVYTEEENYFPDTKNDSIIDLYDAIPSVANIIAYCGDVAVGTLRINLDSSMLLPSDSSYDFQPYRELVRNESLQKGLPAPVFGSAGMLAITQEWRNRRDVFYGLFRMATDIGHSWGATHIIASVNEVTARMYKRLGWETLSEKIWMEEINEYILPVACSMETMYAWAFGMFSDKQDLIESFSGCFQWHLTDAGAKIFEQGQDGDKAYLITRGTIDITRYHKPSDKTLSLAKLTAGDIFGEMSLIDNSPRSATATATSNTELIIINRETFWEVIHENPEQIQKFMHILSARLRDTDDRALLYAYAPAAEKLKFFINSTRNKNAQILTGKLPIKTKLTVTEFAEMSAVPHEEAEEYLNNLQINNRLEINKRGVTFFDMEEL